MNKAKLLALAGLASVTGLVHAAQDYTGVQTAITGEITAVMPIVLAIGGVLLGIGVGFRLIKRAGKF